MKYIIMCGGVETQWKEPRQLLQIHGEPIVARTIRLLREAGAEDIAISSNHDCFDGFGVPVLRHNNPYVADGYNKTRAGTWCDCFYPTNEPTTYIMGDVVFSPAAIKTIVEYQTDDIMFFGSAPPFRPPYPKWYEEPFAFKVFNTDHLHQAVADVKRLEAEGKFHRQPIAWEVWNVISKGADGNINQIDYSSYVRINDYTCDIDYPSELEIMERLARRT